MKIRSGFVLEQVGSTYIAVAVGECAKNFTGLVKMNETGAFLWNLAVEKDVSLEALVDAMLAEYDVPRDIAERDVIAFEAKLRASGIIE